jgi:hypothetical protein
MKVMKKLTVAICRGEVPKVGLSAAVRQGFMHGQAPASRGEIDYDEREGWRADDDHARAAGKLKLTQKARIWGPAREKICKNMEMKRQTNRGAATCQAQAKGRIRECECLQSAARVHLDPGRLAFAVNGPVRRIEDGGK